MTEASFIATPATAVAGPSPIAGRERIDDIDVLRGMALCGVCVSNVVEMFRAPWDYRPPGSGPIDDAVGAVMATAFQGNTITLTFSMMFGLGMAISSGRMLASGASDHRFLIRKQLILLAIGLAHAILIWNGDILGQYAVVGLLMLPLLGRGTRTLLVAALLMAIVFCLPIFPTRAVLPPDEVARQTAHALDAYANGTWLEVYVQRIMEWQGMQRVAVIRWIFGEGMAFCLGMAAWRSGILREPEKHLRMLRWTAILGVASLTVLVLRHVDLLPSGRPPSSSFWLRFLYHLAYTELALAYCAGILLLLRQPLCRRWLLHVAPLGQMNLSNYLMQSVVFAFVFYGYGLGQYGKWPTAIAAVFAFGFYLLQVVLSAAWLRRFRFGPMEWLWRVMSYGRLQPLRKEAR